MIMVICGNMKELSCVPKLVAQPIYHQYSCMCRKSEVVVLDVLHKNEISNAAMLSIMKTQQRFLKDHNSTVLSGGDQLICERRRCAKRMSWTVTHKRIVWIFWNQ